MGRVEETNKALTEFKDTVIEALKATSDSHAAIAHVITFNAGVNEEIAKNLAQLADDIHFLRETMAKEKEEAKERSKLTCGNCKYSYVIDHIDTGFLTRFNVEFCHHRDTEVDFRFTPICKHFEQKEEEAES